MAKAEIDYMTQFVTAWITFNSWYSTKYSRIKGDRAKINKIATETSGIVAKVIENFLENGAQPCVDFRNQLAGLHYELEQAQLGYKQNYLSFHHIINGKDAIQTSPNNSGPPRVRSSPNNYVECGPYFFVRDALHTTNLVPLPIEALVQVLYQLRNRLFHGDLKPSDDLQLIYMHAYFILLAIDRELAK